MSLCVDDFGATKGVNNAVEKLCSSGILDRAALMVNGCEFKSAVKVAQKNSGLSVGLHLVLTDLEPVGSSFKKAGMTTLPSRRNLLFGLLSGKLTKQMLMEEATAQMDRIHNSGIKVDFINGHQHVHVLPIVNEVIINIAIENRCSIRNLSSGIYTSLFPLKNYAKRIATNFFQKKVTLLSGKNKDLFHNDVLVSNFQLSKASFSLEAHLSILEIASRRFSREVRIEYMLHPAAELKGLAKYWYVNKLDVEQRLEEFKSVMSSQFKESLYEKF